MHLVSPAVIQECMLVTSLSTIECIVMLADFILLLPHMSLDPLAVETVQDQCVCVCVCV